MPMFNKLNIFTSRHNRQGDISPLPVHTDIHAHLVPGIDDGAKSVEEAAGLAMELEALGLKRMVLTPHVTDEVFPNTIYSIDTALNPLRRELNNRGSLLRIDVSAEYRIDDFFITQLQNGLARPLPGEYILIENGWLNEPYGLEGLVRELKNRYGYKPVMAHPERYPYYLHKPNDYFRLREYGLLFQINLLSLAGCYGKEVRETAKELLRKEMVEFLGTDLHNEHHLKLIKEYLCSRDYQLLQRYAPRLLNDTLPEE